MPEPSCPLPTRAYNLELLHQDGGPGEQSHGWCFGLPPRILPEQWPLDPLTGYPLVHGFTLRLPPDYRCHGPDIAGFSFFACCSEHSDGGTTPAEEIFAVMTGETAPADARYLQFWTSVQNSHPRLSRMSDILDDNYAVILVTEAKLNGPLCRPPDMAAARALSTHAAPKWFEIGNGRPLFGSEGGSGEAQRHYLFKVLGGAPEARFDWSRGLRWSLRAADPANRRRIPSPATRAWDISSLIITKAARSRATTIASTPGPRMVPPRLSPFHVGFEEYLGGYNFGTGNCQLDFLNMKLDWACS